MGMRKGGCCSRGFLLQRAEGIASETRTGGAARTGGGERAETRFETRLGVVMTVEGVTAVTPTGETLRVREVWEDNLEHEMKIIRDCIEKFPFVAMDTEFPGVVARPVGNFKNSSEYHYQTLRVNVDMLKLIQLGLTLSDKDGNLPRHNDEICVWQFNFREFDVANDIHSGEPPRVRRGGASSSRGPRAEPGSEQTLTRASFPFLLFIPFVWSAGESIELLKTSGIDFESMAKRGIDVHHFGELLMCSGVVLNDRVSDTITAGSSNTPSLGLVR